MIIIDGETYNVPIIRMKGAADALDKYAERTNDGVLHREMIGMFDNYDIEFAASYHNPGEYARLWNKLTESTPWHFVVFPTVYGTREIEGYFANSNHEAFKLKNGVMYWKSLSTSFVSRRKRPI